jgi:hypothetical protein
VLQSVQQSKSALCVVPVLEMGRALTARAQTGVMCIDMPVNMLSPLTLALTPQLLLKLCVNTGKPLHVIGDTIEAAAS